jgi:hypothetical protein
MRATRYFSGLIADFLRIVAVTLLAPLVLNGQSGTAQTTVSGEPSIAAEPVSPSPASLIPQQIRYSGTVPERSGDTVEAVFRIYTARDGGDPLWAETQRVAIAPDGRYTVLLGSVSEAGLPQTVFAAGQARWIGVSIERGEEQPRTLLASVAYAMKAADAETLAGQAVSAFVTRAQLQATARTLAAQATALAMPEATLTGTGTASYLPLWTGASALGDSIVYQMGKTKVGIATKTPAATLDVDGTTALRGTVSLPPAAPATDKAAVDSPVLELGASAFSSSAKAAVVQNFAWRAAAIGNDTAAASASLELLFGSGAAAPTATGLEISSKGVVTFAKGQTFPAPASGPGSGTITRVTAGTALTGGGVSGPVTLSLDTAKVPLLASANTFTGSNTFSNPIAFAAAQTFPAPASGPGSGTITGVSAGTALTGGGTNGPVTLSVDTTKVVTAVTAGAGLTGGGTGGAQTLSVDATKVPLLASANTYSGSETFSGPVTAQSLTVNGNQTIGGTESIGGTTGYLTQLYVVTNGATSESGGAAVLGFSKAASGSGVQGISNGASGAGVAGNAMGNGGVAFEASATDNGYLGSTNGVGLVVIPAYYGVVAHGDCCDGGIGPVNSSTPGQEGTGGGVGVVGEGLFGVQGFGEGAKDETFDSTWGVFGGVFSAGGTPYSAQGKSFAIYSSAGVWGDDTNNSGAGSGVLATADSNTALMAVNNSSNPTMEVTNNTSATHDPVFETYSPYAYGPNSTTNPGSTARYCVIDTSANLECSGAVEAQVANPDVDGKVHAMYAMQSPEVWFEDFGSATLHNGSAHISLEPLFGGTVNSGVEYHVFLTPKGECEGLYVTNEGPGGFDVRELRHGKSAAGFDYRIVAKRKGYETVRMEDQTAQAEARKAREDDRARRIAEAAAHPSTGPARKPLRARPSVPPTSMPQSLTAPVKSASAAERTAMGMPQP